jgi:hypothetical protein
MVIVIPWKPVIIIWLVLSGMLWCGYVLSSLVERKDPFGSSSLVRQHANRGAHAPFHRAVPHKPI